MIKLRTWAAALALATAVGTAPAALVLQSNNLEVLDTDTQLLWLYTWRASVDPLKTWGEGNAWAGALTVGGAAAGEWRMPTIDEFQDLWADPEVGASSIGLKAHFDDVQTTSLYWTGTPHAQNPNLAMAFSPFTGAGVDFPQGNTLYTVAVRSADTGRGGTAVPEPHTAALALLGLAAVAVQGRRRRGGAARPGACSPAPAPLA